MSTELKKIVLTGENYWNEIESSKFSDPVKNILRGLVNSYLSHTIPPSITSGGLALIQKELKDWYIELFLMVEEHKSTSRRSFFLEIAIHIPKDENYRQFAFLRNTYPDTHGTVYSLSLY